MDDNKRMDSIFKNIFRQMVKVSRSAFGLTENVESLSRNIHEQTIQASRVKEENRETLSDIKKILEKTSYLTETAGLADHASRQGREKQQRYLEEVGQLSDSIGRGASFLQEFRKSSEDISRMTQLIMDLSGRLDVLAINGAIEAARSGDAGLGFGVIAREMKNLAQETAVSAERVDSIVKKFETSSRDVQDLFEISRGSLDKSRKDARNIFDVFVDLQDKNRQVAGEVSEINQLIKSLEDRNENRDKSIGKILSAAEASGKQIDQVDKQSTDLHRVVDTILESTGEIRLDWHDKALDSLKTLLPELESSERAFSSVLQNAFRSFPYLELLYVMDDKGIQVDDNVVNPEFSGMIAANGAGEDRSNRSYFRELNGDQDSYISGLYLSTAVNHLCLTISVPFYRDGRRYVLAADIDLQAFVKQS